MAHELKIKTAILKNIEANRFNKFASHTQAKGFIKNYAKLIGLNYLALRSIYLRDVETALPVKRKKLNHKAYAMPKIVLTRKTFYTIFGIGIFIIASIFLIKNLEYTLALPKLELITPFELQSPYEGTITYESNLLTLEGKTDSMSTVFVNDVPLPLDPFYNFELENFPVTELLNIVVIKSVNTLGRESLITLKLVKPTNFFEKVILNIDIVEPTSISVKADDIILFSGIAAKVGTLDFEAFEKIELYVEDPSKANIRINGDIYPLQKQNYKIINKKTEIAVE